METIKFHRIYKADQVDRVVVWNAKLQKTTFPRMEFIPAVHSKFPENVRVFNGEVRREDIPVTQLLALGGEHSRRYKLKELFKKISDPASPGRFASEPLVGKIRHIEDALSVNTPHQFSQVIVEPDEALTSRGWEQPLMLEMIEKPKVEKPSDLFLMGLDPSDECRHFVGFVTWKLSESDIRHWNWFSNVEVVIKLYTSYLLEDMKEG